MHLPIGILVVCLTSAHALIRLRPLSGAVETVQIEQVHSAHARVERSAEGVCIFPYLLPFRFEVNETEIVLNLQKNDYLMVNVPLYVMKDGQLVEKEIPEQNNYAYYQDPNRGSSMLVSCEDDGSFRLHGSFRYNGEMYHISPSNVPELAQNHFIQRNGPNEDRYRNDAIIPPSVAANDYPNSTDTTREKRDATSADNIVELLFATDDSMYNYFLEDQGTDAAAETALQQYVRLLVNEMDLHYMSVGMTDSSFNIRTYLAGVIIAKKPEDATWSTSSRAVTDGIINRERVTKTYIDVNVILENVKAWRQGKSFRQHDHMMAISRFDLADFSTFPVSTGVEGVAYVGTVCKTNDEQISFTEVDGSRVAGVAAHELGHGLNSQHDGIRTSSACSSEAKNIMTAIGSSTTTKDFAEAQWTFSTCSVAAFKSFINGLSFNCLQDHDTGVTPPAQFNMEQQLQLPGTVYSLDDQCKLYDSTSSCQSTLSESSCYAGFRCATDNGCSGGHFPLYPLAGTSCGSAADNKWCYRGLCVERTVIATTTTTTVSTPSTSSSTTSSTTSTTLSTTTTSGTTSTTQSTTTTSGTTSSTQSTTTTSGCTQGKCCKRFWIGWAWKVYCCAGKSCCGLSWAQDTTCFQNCCPVTTPAPTVSPYCGYRCCVRIRVSGRNKRACCIGNDCCQQTWGVYTPCCRYCQDNGGNENTSSTTTPVATTTTSVATTTSEPCYRGKCCGTIRKRRRTRRVCCKGAKCCRFSWAAQSICCRTCRKPANSSESR